VASEIKQIAEAAWNIVRDPRSSRIERLEGLKLIAGCKGVLLPDVDERWLTVRQVTQLRRIKQELVERVLRRKAARNRQNRRAYLRRRIKALENQEGENVGRVE
jgi:hypothetical protein